MTQGQTIDTKIAWFNCFAGIAGDMAMGSLLDAGADLDQVKKLLKALPVRGWSLEAEQVTRAGLAATRAVVGVQESETQRKYADIVAIFEQVRWPTRLRDRALSVFAALAIAEGKVHRMLPEDVHFHEVGSLDAIIDVAGTCAALEVLDIDLVTASPVALGYGVVQSSHGILPNPAPAVVELLNGICVEGLDVEYETTTPTGAAIVAALSSGFGAQPSMVIKASGMGAGTRDTPQSPNLTQVIIGTGVLGGIAVDVNRPALPNSVNAQSVCLLETNLDDVTGEILGHTLGTLLEQGAYDAWLTPAVMKKGRPAHVLHVLCEPADVWRIRNIVAEQTGTLGIRIQTIQRWLSSRRMDHVQVHGKTVRIKVGAARSKAEYEDAASAARELGMPIREVIQIAEQLWSIQNPTTDDSCD